MPIKPSPHQPFPWPASPTALQPGGTSADGLLRVLWELDAPPQAQWPPGSQAMGQRFQALLCFAQGASELLRRRHPIGQIAVQLHDEQPGQYCFRFDAPLGEDGGGPLIPDPYCLMTDGYQAIRNAFIEQPLPLWQERLPMAFWRGSTTSSKKITPATLSYNQRYQLCLQSLQLPALLDARFSAVVQCHDQYNQAQVQKLLEQQDLWSPRVDPWQAALHRWLIEIDGNVNSWGLLWKLLSGACVIRVASRRRQWYHHRLKPWVHLVPVAADLSNLAERLHWCQANAAQCSAIAAQGQQLAEQVVSELNQDLLHATFSYSQEWQLN